MIVASSSPVKFSKIVFCGVKLRAKFEVALQKQSLSVITYHSKSDFFTVNWAAESEKIRKMYYTEFLLNTATIREAKHDCIWLFA